MIKISVIVPIFNVEKYLHQCVDSILYQKYRNFEVILVDDGSTDTCPQICDEYREKDERVIVIHKKNGGSSDARNEGIRRSTGEYIMFLDSDDYWESDSVLEKIIERISLTEAEVMNFSYYDYYENTKERKKHFANTESMSLSRKSKEQQLEYITDKGVYIASVWNKVIKREVIFKNNLFFYVGVTSEDIPWCMKLMICASSFDYYSEEVLVYRHRSGSISMTVNEESVRHLKDNIFRCLAIIDEYKCKNSSYYYKYAAYQYATFVKFQALGNQYYSNEVKELNHEKWILKYYVNKKVKLLYLLSLFFSFETICRFFYFYMHIGKKE